MTTTVTPANEETIRATIRDLVLDLSPNRPAGGLDRALRLVEDLHYHSLALMELAFTLEDEFGLDQINEQQALKIVSAGDIEEHVISELKRKGKLS